MSSVKIQGDASGTGILTIAAPNTNTDRTLTLPDVGGGEFIVSDASGNVGIGTVAPTHTLELGALDTFAVQTGSTVYDLTPTAGAQDYAVWDTSNAGSGFAWNTNGSERMRIDPSGNLLVSKTAVDDGAGVGLEVRSVGKTYITRDSASTTASVLDVNKKTGDGDIIAVRKDGATVGSIGVASTDLYITNATLGFRVYGGGILPCNSTGGNADNLYDVGALSVRWDDIYATNGTIQTSDANEKQDIDVLNDAEQRVAQACKGLLRKFRWKDSVAEKGDDARIHFGIIAQDLKAAFEAEGLDAGRYAMFISSTWTDEETGEERIRMGVRYPELLAFIIAAI